MTPPTHAQVEAIRQRHLKPSRNTMTHGDVHDLFAYLDALTAERDESQRKWAAVCKITERAEQMTYDMMVERDRLRAALEMTPRMATFGQAIVEPDETANAFHARQLAAAGLGPRDGG